MLQKSRTSFTRHIQDRNAAAIQVIHDIPHLSLLSSGTAIALFYLKFSADLESPHRTESKEAGKHETYDSGKSTVHLQIHAHQTSIRSSW
jgi:hypothetical protein